MAGRRALKHARPESRRARARWQHRPPRARSQHRPARARPDIRQVAGELEVVAKCDHFWLTFGEASVLLLRVASMAFDCPPPQVSPRACKKP